ncbi:Unknown protein, partial [Striga hermonthica]
TLASFIILSMVFMGRVDLDFFVYCYFASKQSDDLYLKSPNKACFITDRPSNVPRWKDQFVYIRPPQPYPWAPTPWFIEVPLKPARPPTNPIFDRRIQVWDSNPVASTPLLEDDNLLHHCGILTHTKFSPPLAETILQIR